MQRKDITGKKFGKLVIVRQHPIRTKRGMIRWICKCDCGNSKIVSIGNLISGTKSCGCISKERLRDLRHKHGKTNTSEYTIWCGMKRRCLNPNEKCYYRYGGKGIKVCDRWLNSFENFLLDMGPRPSPKHSLDRYPNQKGDYGPSNCRWATIDLQNKNRIDNVWIEYNERKMILSDWAKELGINSSVLGNFLKKSTIEDAIMYYGVLSRRKGKD